MYGKEEQKKKTKISGRKYFGKVKYMLDFLTSFCVLVLVYLRLYPTYNEDKFYISDEIFQGLKITHLCVFLILQQIIYKELLKIFQYVKIICSQYIVCVFILNENSYYNASKIYSKKNIHISLEFYTVYLYFYDE